MSDPETGDRLGAAIEAYASSRTSEAARAAARRRLAAKLEATQQEALPPTPLSLLLERPLPAAAAASLALNAAAAACAPTFYFRALAALVGALAG